ncbi:hypothetical protein AVEN_239263-1, partial [Araneus ventricosus]
LANVTHCEDSIVFRDIGHDVLDPSQASQKGLLVAATLVDMEMEAIPVRVLNLNSKPKILDKGDVIATCEPVVDIVARPQEFSGAQHLPSTLENCYKAVKSFP